MFLDVPRLTLRAVPSLMKALPPNAGGSMPARLARISKIHVTKLRLPMCLVLVIIVVRRLPLRSASLAVFRTAVATSIVMESLLPPL